jgi:hypothetical protein
MKPSTRIKRPILHTIKLFSALHIGLALVLIFNSLPLSQPVQADLSENALQVQVATSQGFAAPGNSLPANFLVVVTDSRGVPVTNLVQADFFISNQFTLPGQSCGFSNNIVSFTNVLNGAYRIQVDLVLPGCTWVEGDYLAYVTVTQGVKRGQAPCTLSVKCPDRCVRQG